jgi:hypothetical protein
LAAEAGSPPPAGCGDAVVPRDRQGGRKGFEAESRRERWSPEPGHLMGGELGDEGGQARPEGSRRTELERQQRQRQGEAARTRTAWRDAIPAGRLPEQTGAAGKGGEDRHEQNILLKRQVAAARRCASSRPSREPGGSRANGAWAARERRAQDRKAAGHGASLPKATHRRRGRAVPRIWFEQNETTFTTWPYSMSETIKSSSAC